MPVSEYLTAMSWVSFASFWYTIGPRLTEPGVYEPISGSRFRGSMRQVPTSTPARAARPPVEI